MDKFWEDFDPLIGVYWISHIIFSHDVAFLFIFCFSFPNLHVCSVYSIMVDIRYVYLILKYYMIFIGTCVQICYLEIDFQ